MPQSAPSPPTTRARNLSKRTTRHLKRHLKRHVPAELASRRGGISAAARGTPSRNQVARMPAAATGHQRGQSLAGARVERPAASQPVPVLFQQADTAAPEVSRLELRGEVRAQRPYTDSSFKAIANFLALISRSRENYRGSSLSCKWIGAEQIKGCE